MTKVLILGALCLILFPSIMRPGAQAQSVTKEEVLRYLSDGGPSRGSDKAGVTLIEFSDFQCSFCRKFWQNTLPPINRKYIKNGRLRFIYRHFAILGRPSVAAAHGAECAGEQGKFWPYHDRLFTEALSPLAFTQKKLTAYAQDLKLDAKRFDQCLESEKYAKKVKGETAMAAFLGARGTPAFFLNGRLIAGAQPFKVFAEAIEKELEKTRGK